MKKFLLSILLFFMSLTFVSAESETVVLPTQIGKIINVEYNEVAVGEVNQTKQVAQVKILNGFTKNQIIIVDNMLTGNPYYDIKLKAGMKVTLHAEVINHEL